jgi:hypothetical protein
MPFDKDWNQLGYALGDADFYEINYADFGEIGDAIPADCAAALKAAKMEHRVTKSRDIQWLLVSVSGNVVNPARKVLSGPTEIGSGSCTEHDIWPKIQIQGGPYRELFVRDQSLVIYTTLAPCLKCCNSLIGVARCRNMNILVRCRDDYEFLGVRREMDLTVMIPKKDTVTSTASPAKGDRAVFVLHNGNMDFSTRRAVVKFKGSIRKAKDYQCLPHRTIAGETCGALYVRPIGDNKTGLCNSCGEVQRILSRVGSSTPWSADYDPALLQNK